MKLYKGVTSSWCQLGYHGNQVIMCAHMSCVILPCVCVTVCVGMTRDDLFNTNASIVQKLAEAAARFA